MPRGKPVRGSARSGGSARRGRLLSACCAKGTHRLSVGKNFYNPIFKQSPKLALY
jgi:hypothetical protein